MNHLRHRISTIEVESALVDHKKVRRQRSVAVRTSGPARRSALRNAQRRRGRQHRDARGVLKPCRQERSGHRQPANIVFTARASQDAQRPRSCVACQRRRGEPRTGRYDHAGRANGRRRAQGARDHRSRGRLVPLPAYLPASGPRSRGPESTLALSKADQPCCGRVRLCLVLGPRDWQHHRQRHYSLSAQAIVAGLIARRTPATPAAGARSG